MRCNMVNSDYYLEDDTAKGIDTNKGCDVCGVDDIICNCMITDGDDDGW